MAASNYGKEEATAVYYHWGEAMTSLKQECLQLGETLQQRDITYTHFCVRIICNISLCRTVAGLLNVMPLTFSSSLYSLRFFYNSGFKALWCEFCFCILILRGDCIQYILCDFVLLC